jgi:hypothetical protein
MDRSLGSILSIVGTALALLTGGSGDRHHGGTGARRR